MWRSGWLVLLLLAAGPTSLLLAGPAQGQGCDRTERWELQWQTVGTDAAVSDDAWVGSSLPQWDACGPVLAVMSEGRLVALTSVHDASGPRLVEIAADGTRRWSSLDVAGPGGADGVLPVGRINDAPAALVWTGDLWVVIGEDQDAEDGALVVPLPAEWRVALSWWAGGQIEDRASTNSLLVDGELVSLVQAEGGSLWATHLELRSLGDETSVLIELPTSAQDEGGDSVDLAGRVASLRGSDGERVLVEFDEETGDDPVVARWEPEDGWTVLRDAAPSGAWVASDTPLRRDPDSGAMIDLDDRTLVDIERVDWTGAALANQWPVRAVGTALAVRWVDPGEPAAEAEDTPAAPAVLTVAALAVAAVAIGHPSRRPPPPPPRRGQD